jgi:hypothetical protein
MPSGTVGDGGGASEYVPIVTAVTKIGVLGACLIPAKGHRIEKIVCRVQPRTFPHLAVERVENPPSTARLTARKGEPWPRGGVYDAGRE